MKADFRGLFPRSRLPRLRSCGRSRGSPGWNAQPSFLDKSPQARLPVSRQKSRYPDPSVGGKSKERFAVVEEVDGR
jgi:hypothetical protein